MSLVASPTVGTANPCAASVMFTSQTVVPSVTARASACGWLGLAAASAGSSRMAKLLLIASGVEPLENRRLAELVLKVAGERQHRRPDLHDAADVQHAPVAFRIQTRVDGRSLSNSIGPPPVCSPFARNRRIWSSVPLTVENEVRNGDMLPIGIGAERVTAHSFS